MGWFSLIAAAVAKFEHKFNGPTTYMGVRFIGSTDANADGHYRIYEIAMDPGFLVNYKSTDGVPVPYDGELFPVNDNSVIREPSTTRRTFLINRGGFFSEVVPVVGVQIATGPPMSGKASVDIAGNLSYSGDGYTYMIRPPNDGETFFERGESLIQIGTAVKTRTDFRVGLYSQYLYAVDRVMRKDLDFSYTYYFDKNNSPAYYIHTSRKLKKGVDVLFFGAEYDSAITASYNVRVIFQFSDWSDL